MLKKLSAYCRKIESGKIPSGIHLKNAVARYKRDRKNPLLVFRKDKVQKVVDFIASLHHFTGKHAGKPFILEPWQLFIVANLYGFYWRSNGKRRYQNAYIEVARKNGKALEINTPIPTPNGWTTMGNISEGDTVYDEKGNPTKVIFTTPVMYDHKCFEIEFEDGEKVIADAEHQWSVKKHGHNKNLQIFTTAEMFKHFKRHRKDKKGIEYLYRVPMNDAVQGVHQELLIDPYVLGLWLGDGSSHSSRFSVGKKDIPMYDILKNQGYSFRIRKDKSCYTIDISSPKNEKKQWRCFRDELRYYNLFKNKHIPSIYLKASKEQRLALLQGLMDTDGYVSKTGECEIVQKSKKVTDGFSELLSSLGIKHNVIERDVFCNGKSCGLVYRITFFVDKTFPCFRLERKYERLKNNLHIRMNFKSIINIVPVASVPVKCIQVDSPNSLYVFGKKYTVTHNTALVAALALYHLKEDGEWGSQILFTANSLDQSKIGFTMVNGFVHKLDPDEEIFKTRFKDIHIEKTESFIKVLASDSSKLDGYNCSLGVVDEYHSAPDSKVRDVIRSSQGMRENPMLLTITTAGFDKTLPCFDLRTVAAEIIAGHKIDDSFFAVIYTMDVNDDWQDPKNWIKSNPNLGVTVNKEFLEREVLQAKNNPSDEVGVKTKNFNVWCDSYSVWIPDDYIVKSTMKLPIEFFKNRPEPTFCGVDLAANVDLTAVAYLYVEGQSYYFKVDYYIPKDTLGNNRVHADKDLYLEWAYQKYLKTTPGNVTDYDYITRDILYMNSLNAIDAVYYDKFNATQWAISATEEGLNIVGFSQTIGNFNQITREYERLMLNGRIFIDDNPITRYCLRNVELKADLHGNVKPNKGSEKRKIDGVIAMLQALAAKMDYDNNYKGTNIY